MDEIGRTAACGAASMHIPSSRDSFSVAIARNEHSRDLDVTKLTPALQIAAAPRTRGCKLVFQDVADEFFVLGRAVRVHMKAHYDL